MDKVFWILKDIAIILVLLSISYIFINFQSIQMYSSAILNTTPKQTNLDKNKNIDSKSSDEKKVLFLYNNSKEAKRSKENNIYVWNKIIKTLINDMDLYTLIKKDNNKEIEEQLKKKREKLLTSQKKKKDLTLSDKKYKQDDFFSLSVPLNEEENKKYWNKSYISIPKLNINAPIFYPNIEEKHLETHILSLLQKWVVHRPETQLPYQQWNFFILWHSSNYARLKSKYSNIFSKIDLLNLWDNIYVYYKGRKYTYELSEKKIVDSSAIEVYWYIPWYNLSIMTCWPIWSAKNRLIAISKLKKPIN